VGGPQSLGSSRCGWGPFRCSKTTAPLRQRPRYHLRCSRAVALAAIRNKPTRPSVTAASSSANAVPRRMPVLGSKADIRSANAMSTLSKKRTLDGMIEMCATGQYRTFAPAIQGLGACARSEFSADSAIEGVRPAAADQYDEEK